jgi:hypothetical protein
MWVLVRIAGIIVGIATLLRLATTQGLVTYDPLFQEWMDRLRDVIELSFLTDLIEPLLIRTVEWLRSFGVALPELNEAWRPVFIFGALYCGAYARNYPNWHRSFLVPAAFGFSFIGALVAGLSNELGIVAGVLVAYSLLMFLDDLLDLTENEIVVAYIGLTIVFRLSSAVMLTIAAVIPGLELLVLVPIGLYLFLAYVTTNLSSTVVALSQAVLIAFAAFAFFEVPDALLLLGVAGFILLDGIDSLRIGIARSWPDGLSSVADDPMTKHGLDLLSVLLGSLFVASLFADPPIW